MSRSLLCAVLALGLCNAGPQLAVADQDTIGPFTITHGQPIDLQFPNHIHPAPSVKVLQFVGEAINNNTFLANLAIHFDYTDQAGNQVIVPLPNFYQNPLPPLPGQLQRIEAGPTTLPFCPEQVSIHFELLTPGEIQFQGAYDHTCIPVPEPNAAVLSAMGVGLAALARRCRRAA